MRSRGIFFLVVAVLLSGCTSGEVNPTPASLPQKLDEPLALNAEQVEKIGITESPVEVKTLPVEIESAGTVEANPNLMTPVISLVPGRIEQVSVQHGDYVSKGQVLARIRSDEVGQIEAEFLSRLLEFQADRKQVKVQVALAQKTYDRKRLLVEEKIAARADLEQSESDLEQARAALAAVDEKEQALVLSTEERLRLFGIRERVVEDLMKNRHLRLVFDIVSPRTGIVTERHADPGEAVAAEKALFYIADLSRIWLVGQVVEKNQRLVKKGMPVKVKVDSLPGETFEGTVDFIDSHVNGDTRTLPVRATVDNSKLRLKPRMFARMTIQVDTATSLVVPTAAVQHVGEASLVYVVQAPRVYRERQVEVGRTVGQYIEIRRGLAVNDRIVVNGSLHLLGEALDRLSQ